MRPFKLRGFSLIELTIGSLIFSVVMGAAFFMLNRWNVISARGEAVSKGLTDGRMALNRISEDIRHAYYIYHFAKVKIDKNITLAGVKLEQIKKGDLLLDYPIISFAAVNPPGIAGSSKAGMGGFSTDSITVLTRAVPRPLYICYFRVPGPANRNEPTAHENTYKPLWYKLIRLEMDCSFEPTVAQGNWHRMDKTYDTMTLASASQLAFSNAEVSYPTGTCSKAVSQIIATAANPDGAIFDIQNPHPYSVEAPVSPYYVGVRIVGGDPLNNYMRTSNGGISAATLSTEAYAQNVTMPGQR